MYKYNMYKISRSLLRHLEIRKYGSTFCPLFVYSFFFFFFFETLISVSDYTRYYTKKVIHIFSSICTSKIHEYVQYRDKQIYILISLAGHRIVVTSDKIAPRTRSLFMKDTKTQIRSSCLKRLSATDTLLTFVNKGPSRESESRKITGNNLATVSCSAVA